MELTNVTESESGMTFDGLTTNGNYTLPEITDIYGNNSSIRNDANNPVTITLAVLMSCISILGTVGNVLLVNRLARRFKQDPRARFMMGTIFSALLMAAIFQPTNVLHLILPDVFQLNQQLCIGSFALRGICVLCHISSVCISSVSNYIYINHPFRGSRWLTLRRVVIVNSAMWTIVVINILGIYVGFLSKVFTFNKGCDHLYLEVPIGFLAGTVYGILVPLLLVSMAVNIRIIVIAQRHIRNIGKHTPSSSEIALSALNVQTSVITTEGEIVKVTKRKSSTIKTRWLQSKPHVIFLLATVIFWIPCIAGATVVVLSNALILQAIKKYLLFALIGVGFGSSSLMTLIEFRKDLLASQCVR